MPGETLSGCTGGEGGCLGYMAAGQRTHSRKDHSGLRLNCIVTGLLPEAVGVAALSAPWGETQSLHAAWKQSLRPQTSEPSPRRENKETLINVPFPIHILPALEWHNLNRGCCTQSVHKRASLQHLHYWVLFSECPQESTIHFHPTEQCHLLQEALLLLRAPLGSGTPKGSCSGPEAAAGIQEGAAGRSGRWGCCLLAGRWLHT